MFCILHNNLDGKLADGFHSAMVTGRSNTLAGQTGEYLVAAELSRRGCIATTFTGNVPHYDIIASNEQGKHVLVQVKASKNGESAETPFEQVGHNRKMFKVKVTAAMNIQGEI